MARTDGDTWDIVTSVGLTALAVCAARALDAALQPPLANDEFAAGFVAAAGEPNLAAAVANTDLTGAAGFNAQWVGVRTRFFDDFFRQAGRSKVRQAVILAAGLDCRAYRLAWPTGTTVFEVDQPRVLEFKQQVLDERGAVPSARRVTIATDLRDDWAGALIAAGFDPTQSTAWALEGLLPYLPGAAQDALFEKLHELSAAGSWVAAELGPKPGELEEFTANMKALSDDPTQPTVGELWYADPRRDTKEWLAERGWEVTGVDLVDAAANGYGRPFRDLPPIFERLLRQKFFTAVRG
ncbi:SAM-dependent methyltransferase [Mycobacterium talmoniae]|uniref:S-adenosyl-L-methionine-dependent methyltransferase n=1 Tax=Mycobacterium talmoniae TaxID=1858794 RepID=A0A1S1NH75_9MYCO|nr:MULTISPECIES: SAM-dependent methyltransferase [Mycobacterium]OHV05131.1 SAM-dependent methyltransferase [Mycobacterium talmoniae]PQM45631.1 Putative S-adenosyl-L-methionine-dependent methyltransferase [Mycobacterium talmoniae]TDH49144.1 SAM-dependent methyltransferase [Mycobacterium eburneum]